MMRALFLPLIPAKAGTQCFPTLRRGIGNVNTSTGRRPKNWVPAFAGMSGDKVEGLTA